MNIFAEYKIPFKCSDNIILIFAIAYNIIISTSQYHSRVVPLK